jgi:hypothetical protein
MAKFLFQLAIFASLIVGGYVLIRNNTPVNTGVYGGFSYSYMSAIRIKHQRANSIKTPKVLFVGGSSSAYGIDSKKIEDLVVQNETLLRNAELAVQKEQAERGLKFLNKSRAETLASQDKLTALIGTDCAALIAEMKETHAHHGSWRDTVVQRLITLRCEVRSGDMDDALSPDAYRKIHEEIWQEGGAYLIVSKDRATDIEIPMSRNYDLHLWYTNALRMTQDKVAFDACFGSEKAANTIPDELCEQIYANAREFKRPFKMGGLHDGCNSVVTDYGPHLLFQLGDSLALTSFHAALYIFVGEDDLEKHDFGKVRWVVEH